MTTLLDVLILLADIYIAYYVRKEYVASEETNKALLKLLDKQKGQKKKVSVDRIIKTALQKGNN